jgi:hypothetical protein
MVKCGVFFAVRTEFLNIICTLFGFKGLKQLCYALLCTLTGRGSNRGKLPFKCGTNKSEKPLNQQQRKYIFLIKRKTNTTRMTYMSYNQV